MHPARRALPLASIFALALSACTGTVGSLSDAGLTATDAGVDAGVDSGTPAAVDSGVTVLDPVLRPSRTQTADVALLDQVEQDLASITDPTQKEARVDQFFADVESEGGTPLTTRDGGTRVAFVARGTPSTGYSAVGEWNGWTVGRDPLAQVEGTSLYSGEVQLLAGGPLPYKLADGTNVFEDLRAHNVVWDGVDRSGWGQFNAYVYPALQDSTKGRLVAWRGVMDPTVSEPRDVFVYLPLLYDTKAAPLPMIVFQDGNESLTRVGNVIGGKTFSMVADEEYGAHPDESSVLVFVGLPSSNERMAQYTFPPVPSGYPTPEGNLYLQFLQDTLVPKVEGAFQICPKAADHGVAGASLGGLISSYAAEQHPETFGFVGSQSGSYFINTVVQDRIAQDPVLPIRFYVDHGCPNDNCDSNRALASELYQRGYDVLHLEQTNAQHDWNWWEGRLPFLLSDFRDGKTGCAP